MQGYIIYIFSTYMYALRYKPCTVTQYHKLLLEKTTWCKSPSSTCYPLCSSAYVFMSSKATLAPAIYNMRLRMHVTEGYTKLIILALRMSYGEIY